jgi:conjugative transfer ATPase
MGIVDELILKAKYAKFKILNPAIMKAVSEDDVEKLYKKSKQSFVDFLPFVDYDEESQAFLLDDCVSVAAVYTLKPLSTEGRSADTLNEYSEKIQRIIQETFVNGSSSWVLQQFNYADKRLNVIRDEISKHIAPHAKGTEFTEDYLNVMEQHYQGIADNEQGIFKDTTVTNSQFRGQIRRCKLVFYRRLTQSEINSKSFDAVKMLNETCLRLESELTNELISFERDNGAEFFNWLLDWFNPNPIYHDKKSDFMKEMSYPNQEDRPYGYDLAENLIFDDSISDPKNKCWWLNGEPTRFIRARQIRTAPKVGLLSGELAKGDSGLSSCMLDHLPDGAMMAQTMVIQSQSAVETHIDTMMGKSKGDTNEVERSQREISEIKETIGGTQHIVKASFGVYVRADDLEGLNRVTRDTTSLLSSAGVVCYPAENDSLSCNAFIVHLPMAFEPKYEKKHQYLKFFYMQHMVNMSLLYGRSEGTGHAVINFWNRGGSPLCFDFLDKDRTSNSHMVIGGPTGSGKSATLCYLSAMVMASIRPRLFIFELGNSFGLLADYMESKGLTVNKKQLKPGAGISLNPFSDSHRIIDNLTTNSTMFEEEEDEDSSDTLEDDQRDVMGEMLSAALLMITGGEKKEYEALTRADRSIVATAIRESADDCYKAKREMLTQDLRDKLREISNQPESEIFDDDMQRIAKRMAASIDSFCHDFDGEMFNSAGGEWPDADVTIIDLATYAKEGYEAQMALTYISLMNHVNALGEKTQHQDRKIIQITDEAHVITTNEMLAPFLVKAVKVQRKIGISSLIATQNFTDFPKDAEKLLNMIDWWMCLCPTKNEVEEISRFKVLTDERKHMMTSTRKQKRCYTEGVILPPNDSQQMLFRNVPPSVYLALAMTEKEEKAERSALMIKHKISEVDAAIMVGANLDKVRGILHDS